MIFLTLAMICSAMIGLLFKYSEKLGANRYVLTSINYLTATVSAGLILIAKPIGSFDPAPLGDTLAEVGRQITETSPELSASNSATYALVLGVPAGIFFFMAFMSYQFAVRSAGVSLAGACSKLAVLVPICISLLLWQEWPTSTQWAGILLAFGAIGVATWPQRGTELKRHFFLLALFLSMGGAEFSKKLFQKLGDVDHKPVFLLTTFAAALCCSLVPSLWKRRPIARRDITLGIAVGIPNLLASYFLISALERYPAAVVFPIFSAGAIVLMCTGAHLIFAEETGAKERIAIALVIPALVLMNL